MLNIFSGEMIFLDALKCKWTEQTDFFFLYRFWTVMQNRLLSLDSNEKIPFCLICFSEFMQFYKLALCDVTKDIATSPKLLEALFFRT